MAENAGVRAAGIAASDVQKMNKADLRRVASSLGVIAASLSEDQVRARVADIIKQCLNAHGGSFDPSQIRHKNLGLSPSDERMYSRLNKVLQPGQLREFVDGQPEFEWHQNGPRGMDGRHLGRCRGLGRLGARLCQCRGADL